LDRSVGDGSASAVDLLAYGRFLDESGFPQRLAYACILKSETLAQSVKPSPLPESAAALQHSLESHLGAEAAAIRRDPDPALSEALALRR
jgi:hypothetical protein